MVVVVGRGEEGGRECEWKRNAWRDISRSAVTCGSNGWRVDVAATRDARMALEKREGGGVEDGQREEACGRSGDEETEERESPAHSNDVRVKPFCRHLACITGHTHTLHASLSAYQHTCTPCILLLHAIRTRASGRQPPHTRSARRVCRLCCARQRCKLQCNAANYSPLIRPSLRWGHLNKRVGGLVLVQRGLRRCRRFHSDERTVPTVVGCRTRSRPYDNHADE